MMGYDSEVDGSSRNGASAQATWHEPRGGNVQQVLDQALRRQRWHQQGREGVSVWGMPKEGDGRGGGGSGHLDFAQGSKSS